MNRDPDQHLDLAPGGASPEPQPHQPDPTTDGPPCRTCVVEHLGCLCIFAEYIEPEGDEDGPF
jgi:hypothetical protein